MTWIGMEKPFITLNCPNGSVSVRRLVGSSDAVFALETGGIFVELPAAQAAALAEGLRWALLEIERAKRDRP
jgi:hypothetical protein